jgi:DNA polymerase-2
MAILRLFQEDREALVEYNRTDARLVLDIVNELRLLELAVERSLLTGMPPDRVSASIAAFDYLYLSELHKRGVAGPTVTGRVSSDVDTPGGHVLEPAPGLHRNVAVLDFRSLYPSIIRTFQIDPLGYVRDPSPEEDLIAAPNRAAFRRETGILTRLLDDLFPRREAAQREGRAVASQAIKILMNSFYGVLGTTACRFADPALAGAITGFGKKILLWSKRWIEAEDHEVLYGDTDSLFVSTNAEDPADAEAVARELTARLNQALVGWIASEWRVESRLEVEFERLYLRLFLPPIRHGTAGARKRYAGLIREGGTEQVIFTGMEVVRRDWTDLARRVQRDLYRRLFTDQPVEEYLREVVRALRAGEYEEEALLYRKALRKPVEKYTASTPPHVAAARISGALVGTVVEYWITAAGPEPSWASRAPLDFEHYVEKQIRPVAEPVLDVLGLDFKQVIGDDRQTSLF